MRFLLKIAVYALALWVADVILDGLRFEGGTLALILIALIFGVINAVVKPIVKVLSLPFIIITLGLFLLVVNTAMLALTIWLSGRFDLGMTSNGFWTTFLAALIVSVVTWIAELVIPDER